MRQFLGVLLVVGLFVVVGVGVVNKQAASELSPLVAPLASLAGIAVGYYFGQGSSPAPDLDEANERPK
jgi:Na+/H+ antiporter NhaD/arsenite permease-like protein